VIEFRGLAQRVIPAIVAGLALFLFGCKPAVRVKPPHARKGPCPETLYSEAEEFYAQGNIQEALIRYSRYLQIEPQGKRAPDCLRRMGDIYLKKEQPVNALQVYARIRRDFPGYVKLEDVEFGVILALWKIGALSGVVEEGKGWIQRYPESSLKSEVELILGRAYYEGLNYDQAFNWLAMAETEIRPIDAAKADEISAQIEGMINEADESALARMLGVSKDTRYYPQVAYRLAAIYYHTDRLDRAEGVITDLLRSSTEEEWLEKARTLYEKILLALNVEPHKIGCLLPLSGLFGIYGQEVLNGIETGLDIFGKGNSAIEVVIKDTAGEPEKAAEGVEELVRDDHVIAAIGPLLSRCSEQAAARAQLLGLPLITICRKEDVVDKGPMVFRNFLLPKKEIEQLVHVAMDRLDIKRFAIMYPDNAYGRYYMEMFWDAVEQRGGQVRAAESYEPSTTDFAAQIKRMVGRDVPRPKGVLEKIRASRLPQEEESELDPADKDPIVDFEAVFIPDSAERVAMIAPQLVYYDVDQVWLLGTSLWSSPRLMRLAGDYLQGAIYTSGFFSASGTVQAESFLEQYRSNYDKEPGLLAATGYDTIRFLKEIITTTSPETRRQMEKAIMDSPPYSGLTGEISFDARGEVKKEPFLVTVLGDRELLFP